MVAAWIGNGDSAPRWGEHAHDVVAETEVGEAHAVDIVGLDGLGLEALEHDVVVRREVRLGALRG